MKLTLTMAAAAAIALAAGAASARDQIRIVGSSTVFPFTTQVAEQFGKTSGFKTPVVESTGTGGGMKLFCAGVGVEHPDFTNASRRIKSSELESCIANGVADVIEIPIGFDGIVVANAKAGPDFDVTLGQMWKALVEGSTAQKWSDVDPSLPAIAIEVLGPPPTSGTRDSFNELVMTAGCEEAGGSDCGKTKIRTDGKYVEAGENDNLIVSKIVANPNAVGVFGFSFLEENSDKIKGHKINGVEPNFETIAAGDYPVSRSMFVYAKRAHIGVVPGMQQFMAEYVSDNATGEDGYLSAKGLIPLPTTRHDEVKEGIVNLVALQVSDLK
jgi:phosphate transport system substrate-binding protein